MNKLFPILFVLLVGTSFSQQVTKLNKYVKAVQSDDSTGIMKGKDWLIRPGLYSWDNTHYGIVIVTLNEHMGLISDKGVLVLDTLYGDIYPLEGTNDLVVRNFKDEYACFSASGKMKIPFASQEFEYGKGYILSMQGDYQMLYDTAGNVVLERDLQMIDLNQSSSRTVVAYLKNGKQRFIMDPKDKLPAPLVHVNGEFVIAKEESSIYDYFWFLAAVKNNPDLTYNLNNDQFVDFESLIIDTNKIEAKLKPLWRDLIRALNDSINEPEMHTPYKALGVYYDVYVPFNFSSEQLVLAQFPVTGVNYEQARLFANWMNQVYSEYYESNAGYTFQFALPTEEQWMEAAKNGLVDQMRSKQVLDSINAKGCFLFNYKNLPACKSLAGYLKSSRGGGAAPVNSFYPNLIGAKNIFGNVAEITATPGIAKGGSYNQNAADAVLTKSQNYSGPEPWLGIRLYAKPIYW